MSFKAEQLLIPSPPAEVVTPGRRRAPHVTGAYPKTGAHGYDVGQEAPPPSQSTTLGLRRASHATLSHDTLRLVRGRPSGFYPKPWELLRSAPLFPGTAFNMYF